MKAMLLAAGRGERMRPLSDTLPKPLLEVAGKPLIAHHLEALARAGYEGCVINLSWLGESIRAFVGDGAAFGIEVEYSEEPQALETAGGIVQALDRLDECFVVVNADIYTDYDFSRLAEFAGLAHIVLVDNPEHNPGGDFSLAGSVVGNAATPRYTFGGVAAYRREFFAALAPGKRPLAPLLRAAAGRGELSGELHAGHWSDIGTPERLAALNATAPAAGSPDDPA